MKHMDKDAKRWDEWHEHGDMTNPKKIGYGETMTNDMTV